MPEVLKRVPPHSMEAEQSILGSMMLSEGCVLQAVSGCRSGIFIRKATGEFSGRWWI